MILAHIFLPAMLIVICKSQQMSSNFPDRYGSADHPDIYGIGMNAGVRSSLTDLSPPPPSSSQSLFSAYNNNNSNELLDRYRLFIANSLIKLPDSCRVYDFLQKIKDDIESEGGDDDSAKLGNNGKFSAEEERYINSLLRLFARNKGADITLFNSNEWQRPRPALFYYLSISLLLQDKDLDEMLSSYLHEKCCKDDDNLFGGCNDGIIKRDNIKKVKFHSWGGKRSGDDNIGTNNIESNSRMPTNSDLGKDSLHSKVVIRTPFRPWGGKRQSFQPILE